MEIKDLESFVKLVNSCKKLGVKSLKDGEFQIELSPEALLPESPYLKRKRAKAEQSAEEPSKAYQDMLLGWSSDPLGGAQ